MEEGVFVSSPNRMLVRMEAVIYLKVYYLIAYIKFSDFAQVKFSVY